MKIISFLLLNAFKRRVFTNLIPGEFVTFVNSYKPMINSVTQFQTHHVNKTNRINYILSRNKFHVVIKLHIDNRNVVLNASPRRCTPGQYHTLKLLPLHRLQYATHFIFTIIFRQIPLHIQRYEHLKNL